MKLLVTGASGFLGRAVVRAAAAAGHQVIAMVRPAASLGGLDWPAGVELLRGDLRQRGAWCADLNEVEAVIHLAAAVEGDLATQFAGTVAATETLLEHLPETIRRFVHVSTFSIYDYGAVPIGGTLTERTPIEPKPEARDAYTITKLVQERLVTEFCGERGVHLVVLRPGAIYGPGKLWDYGSAMKLGRFDLLFAPLARLKLTFVDNCAEAIVKAVDAPVPAGSIFNLVDDDPPTHARFHRTSRRLGAETGRAVYVPWLLVATTGLAVALLNRLAFKDRARLPAFLAYRRQRASWKPMRYANAAAKEGLGWTPRVSLEDGLAASIPRPGSSGKAERP
jgi:2-alkyl-3-oxoalkanoate reductase